MLNWTQHTFRYLIFISVMFLKFFSWGYGKQSIELVTLPDKAQIRLAHYTPEVPLKDIKTVILFPGACSYIERFQETLDDLNKRGYEVWTFDWRGTGGSTRTSMVEHKFHIDKYETYLEDFNYIMKYHIKAQGPIILMGISMGGHLALKFIEQNPTKISAALLIAPMLQLQTPPFPVWMARILGQIAHLLGFDHTYAFGQGPYNFDMPLDPEKMPTSDIERYREQLRLNLKYRHLLTSGVTFGWLYETFRSMDFVNDPKNLKKVQIPVSILQAGQDKSVDNSQNKYLCAYMPYCKLINLPQSRHNIFNEKNEIRDQIFIELETLIKKIKL